jgi:hypothetical protein
LTRIAICDILILRQGPCISGRGTVQVAFKSLLSILLLMLLFEGMVTAFHLLNLPSNLAVVEGVLLLLLIAIAGLVALRGIWKRRWRWPNTPQ